MIILDATTKSLEVILGGAVATNQLPIVASYVDMPAYSPASNDTQTNGGTAVTAVAAPGASVQRQIKLLTVHNADTAAVTVTVRLNSNTTMRTMAKALLPVGYLLVYTDGEGFRVLDAAGGIVGAHGLGVGPANSVIASNGSAAAWDATIALDSLAVPALTAPAAMTVTPAAGSNLNIVLSGAGDFAVNTDDLYVDSSTGNVGIGTTGPVSKLTVAGDLKFDSGAGTNANIFNYRNGYLAFGTNDTENVRIAAGGNVGIGTTAPTSKLQVTGLPVYANNAAAVAGGLTAGAFYRTGADPDPVCVVH